MSCIETFPWKKKNLLIILFQEIVINKLHNTIQPSRNNWDQRRVMCLLVLYSAQGSFLRILPFSSKESLFSFAVSPMKITLLQKLNQVLSQIRKCNHQRQTPTSCSTRDISSLSGLSNLFGKDCEKKTYHNLGQQEMTFHSKTAFLSKCLYCSLFYILIRNEGKTLSYFG